MTPIVATHTKRKGFLFEDQTRTKPSKDGRFVHLKIGNIKFKTKECDEVDATSMVL